MVAEHPLVVDPYFSYARRRGGMVEIVMRMTGGHEVAGGTRLAATSDDGVVLDAPTDARVEADDVRLVARLSAAHLTGGTWQLELRGRGRQQLHTRLLVRSGQPVALLPAFAASALGN